jgi:chemotaxis protein methyltransferase CheR
MNPPLSSLDDVVCFVARHAGLAVANRREGLEAGIRRAMARAGVTDPGAYLSVLARDQSALDDLLGELTIGETYFFREPGQFEFIRRAVLPEFRHTGRPLRAWSAGCASGEEAYSLAILFVQEGLGDRFHLLATDLCRSALERARRGVYRPWSLRGAAAVLARPYLEPAGTSFRVAEAVRRAVVFRPLNLALDPYPSADTGTCAMDLILCRNVLIYLDAETVRRVAGRLFEALTAGGWLITASSDPPLADLAPFEVVTTRDGFYYRRKPGATVPESAGQIEPVTSPPPLSLPYSWGEGLGVGGAPAASDPEQSAAITGSAPSAPTIRRAAGAELQAEARAALARGDYTRALELTDEAGDDPVLAALHVRALANLDTLEAEQACAAAVVRHALSPELAYLYALLLLDLGRDAEAAQALRRVLYLDGALAVAQFTLGSVLERLGDTAGARRAYRNACDLCGGRPPDEPLPLGEGGQAGHLAEAAAARLARLVESSGSIS